MLNDLRSRGLMPRDVTGIENRTSVRCGRCGTKNALVYDAMADWFVCSSEQRCATILNERRILDSRP